MSASKIESVDPKLKHGYFPWNLCYIDISEDKKALDRALRRKTVPYMPETMNKGGKRGGWRDAGGPTRSEVSRNAHLHLAAFHQQK